MSENTAQFILVVFIVIGVATTAAGIILGIFAIYEGKLKEWLHKIKLNSIKVDYNLEKDWYEMRISWHVWSSVPTSFWRYHEKEQWWLSDNNDEATPDQRIVLHECRKNIEEQGYLIERKLKRTQLKTKCHLELWGDKL